MSGLVVHLNGGELYDVEPAVASFGVTGSFEVELRNHGQPVHVHLRLDEELSRVASLSGTNHYVEAESIVRVPVAVAEGVSEAGGMLKIVTGYGSGTDHVEVRVTDEETEEGVTVDEGLGRPRTPDDTGTKETTGGLAASTVEQLRGVAARFPQRFDVRGALVLATVLAVTLTAPVIAVAAAPSLAVVFGIFAVLVGLAVAGYLMVR